MSDFFLQLGQNQSARKIIKGLGLPIPMPQDLARARGPYEDRPLADQPVVVGGEGALAAVIAQTLARAGANPFVIGDDSAVHAFGEPGEAYGRPAARLELSDLPESFAVHGAIFDATELRAPGDLRGLYDFFHPLVKSLSRCGRALVLVRPADAARDPAQAAARAAVEGFTRSLAKEIGKRGATCQLVVVEEGADDRVEGVLRYLLSRHSAFVTGQVVRVSARASARTTKDIPYVRPLEGKTALVTGAARGIGAATARLLADEGATVFCLDRPDDDAPLSQVARDIGGKVILCDVTAADAADTIRREVGERGLDIVVHNAGITRDKTLARMDAERWDLTIAVNLQAVVSVTEALIERGLNDGGRVICLSSIAGLAGNLGQTNYAASKAGVVGFVERLAGEVAQRGITVNAIAPGFIETRLTAAIPVMIREVARRLSAVGQGGLPRDVGDAITFLATPGAQGITGSVLRVCGGAFVGR